MEFNNTKENMIDEIEPTPKKYDYTKEIWLRELNYLNPNYRNISGCWAINSKLNQRSSSRNLDPDKVQLQK